MPTLWCADLRWALILLVFTGEVAHAAMPDEVLAAQQVIVIDAHTQTVLVEKNADEPIAPASLTKIMTAAIVFDAISNGTIRLDDRFTVSVKAWKTGGSRMFLEPMSQVTVLDLLRGIIVQSGNDAAITLAEGLYGTEENFAAVMTEQAGRWGLKGTQFKNSTGLPQKDHYSTARDLAYLSLHTIRDFPHMYDFYKEKVFTHNEITQYNRNPLLGSYEGVDGLKTGHVKASGYSLAASVKRGRRRLIMVVSGLSSEQQRKQESQNILDWSFRHFANYRIGNERALTQLPLWWGQEDVVRVQLAQPLLLTMRRSQFKDTSIRLRYVSPAIAPIEKGDVMGEVMIIHKDGTEVTHPIVAVESVAARASWLKPFAFVARWLRRAL